jgi:hypothetical protein
MSMKIEYGAAHDLYVGSFATSGYLATLLRGVFPFVFLRN